MKSTFSKLSTFISHIFIGCIAIIGIVFVSSCDGPEKDMIWDISPVGIFIDLVDEDGNNLLDPNVEGNWVGCLMTIKYDEEDFPALWEMPDRENLTRYYMPMFYGFIWEGAFNRPNNNFYSLYFGEFTGDQNHKIAVTFELEGHDSVYEIVYDHKFKWKHKEPHFDDHIYLNGKKHDGCSVEIVLPPRKD